MYIVLVAVLFLYVIPRIVLDVLQLNHIKKHSKSQPIILDKCSYIMAANYSMVKLKVSILRHIYELILILAWLSFGISLLSQFIMTNISGAFLSQWCILMAFICLISLISLPFSIIESKIDKKFGFNKQSFSSVISDTIKSIFIGGILFGIIFAILLWLMESVAIWWLFAFIFMFSFMLLMQVVMPRFIAPMFNKFSPLENKELEQRILELMQKVGFKSNGIFVMDASKRDGRLNAYFGGLGSSKRVVLFDTLLEKVSDDGLIAILGHELGHFKHNDVLKQIILIGIIMFCIFLAMGILCEPLCEFLGVSGGYSAIVMITFILAPIPIFLIRPIINYFSRKSEYMADDFGASCVSKKALSSALIRLVNENKSFPHSHPAFTFFYYSHPPLIDRLRALDS